MSVMFLYSGALFPESIPQYFSSLTEVTGQALLIILTPAFLVTYLIIAQRRSVRFAESLVANRLITSDPADWLQEIRARTVTCK